MGSNRMTGPAMVTIHRTSQRTLADLQADLELLDLRLARQVVLAGDIGGEHEGSCPDGLPVQRQRDEGTMPQEGERQGSESGDPEREAARIPELERELNARRSGNQSNADSTRLDELCRALGLNEFEAAVVALCLVLEIDSNYARIYSYLQGDLSPGNPTVELALQVICGSADGMIEHRRSFANSAPLIKYRVIELSADAHQGSGSLLDMRISLDSQVADFLLGGPSLDARLAHFVELNDEAPDWDSVVFPEETKVRLLQLPGQLSGLLERKKTPVLHLWGAPGCGRQTVARAICRSLGRRLLATDCAGLLASEVAPGELMSLVSRQALLEQAVVLFRNTQLLLGEDQRRSELRKAMARLVRESKDIIVLCGDSPWRALDESGAEGARVVELGVKLPLPGLQERSDLWRLRLAGLQTNFPDRELALLSAKYRCSGREIGEAVAAALDRASVRNPASPIIELTDLSEYFRAEFNNDVKGYSRRYESSHTLQDLVLPEENKEQLREICSRFRHMSVVFGEWGYECGNGRDKGLTALFTGPSGTGKTMAAEAIATELELDLLRVDLSNTLSKYIGETEKNLEQVFLKAERGNAILLFDEADALFGKRAEVRNSQDRYSNIEVSYLLQRIEEYQGIAILTTNLRNNMDEAFLRRLNFAVEFPFPDEEHRLQIWQKAFPPRAPLDPDVDFSLAARQFRISGGSIKNISLNAAFLAAQEGGPIRMRHLVQATRREYVKMGKLQSVQEFGAYFHLEPASGLVTQG